MTKKAILLTVLCTGLAATARADQGARYLIICRDEFVDAIRPLAEWKHAQGVMSKVVPTSVTGNGLSEIDRYIADAYNTWPVRPEFVLLVGHPSYIPAARYGQHWHYYSDNDYADVTGDFRAELAIGRFPVRSVAQTELMVAKTLNYEKEPDLTDSLWMRRLTTVVREDHDWDDTIYWNNARYAASLAGSAGFVSCDSLSRDRGHDSVDVVNSVNLGTGLVLYRGTGTGNWASPFTTLPQQTTNYNRLPVILSVTCATMALDPYDSMVGSAWVKTGYVGGLTGAVAFFGNTHSSNNVARVRGAVARGFFTGLFVDGEYCLGNAILRAKRQLYQEYPYYADDYRGFSLFGDPELKLWTATPRPLDVGHLAEIRPLPQQCSVTVFHNGVPVPGAVVCATMDTTVFEVETTDVHGVAWLHLSPADTGRIRLVVTGRNCLPYDGGILVTTQVPVPEPHQPRLPDARLSALPAAFLGETTLRWYLPAGCDWTLAIVDALGRSVQRHRGSGTAELRWGPDSPAGVYLAELRDRRNRLLGSTRLSKLD